MLSFEILMEHRNAGCRGGWMIVPGPDGPSWCCAGCLRQYSAAFPDPAPIQRESGTRPAIGVQSLPAPAAHLSGR